MATEAKLNLLLDEIVRRLSAIQTGRTLLNRAAGTVKAKRVLRLGDFSSAAKPLCAVQLVSWTASPTAGHRFEGTAVFAVHCIVTAKANDPSSGEQEMIRLSTDVLRAVQKDETQGGLVTYTFPTEMTINVDAVNGSGYAVASLFFECLYTWDAVAP